MGIITGLRRLLSRDSAEKALHITASPPRDTAPPLKPRTRKGSRPAKKPLIKGKSR